ncbi:MAG: hypothetical protein FWC01_00050 [Treponema sp.]|nr:hypothetical protein [Treponema sp.]
MKNILIKLFIFTILVAAFLSCDVGLGPRLDIQGPEISITYPSPRKPVFSTFTIKGTARDSSGVELMEVKVVLNNEVLQNQWRYANEQWQASSDGGVNWALCSEPNTYWEGTNKDGVWSLDITLPNEASDGEYTVVVQAWDRGEFSDDNSYATRVVIVDSDPPKVNITDPFLYYEYGAPFGKPQDPLGEFAKLEAYSEDPNENTPAGYKPWLDPANIGKFITRGFNLQYQIDDNHDVWSIQINLYDADDPAIMAAIDGDPNSPLPEGAIFKHNENTPPPPESPQPNDTIRPNGSFAVPALETEDGNYGKRTIVVVACSYDAAGNASQEKIMGYFIYWPLADKPWITFTDGMYAPSEYPTEQDVYMVYPGREIKATAFAAHGVTKITGELYRYPVFGGERGDLVREITIDVEQRFNGVYTTIFPWEFMPPSSTGFYSIQARAIGVDTVSEDYEVMFFVQDVSFPDFPQPPSPSASLPLFQSIGEPDVHGKPTGNNKIRISGTVGDATKIASLSLVWINPESKGFAAMSQLQYFRDSDYLGWREVITLGTPPGQYVTEGIYDQQNPNKVWNVEIFNERKDVVTDRMVYDYSLEIDITEDLRIAGAAPNNNSLRSQVFLLKASNPDNKSTIITYAPQGDESSPVIGITSVTITGSQSKECIPGEYALLEQFQSGDKITISGIWEEDSIEYLDFQTYLKNNFRITINGIEINNGSGASLTFDPESGSGVTGGTWEAEVILGDVNLVKADNIKDTLVVAARVFDIGGNISEDGGSWLIKSDRLRLLRISSEMANTKYNATIPADNASTPPRPANTIRIFLEFNRPVALTNGGNPQIQLNNIGGSEASRRATYVDNAIQSTRQYFDYVVAAGHNTVSSDDSLDVIGLVGLASGNYWENPNYAFTWHSGSGEEREEIRITNEGMHDGETLANNAYLRRLPLYSHTALPSPDRPFSLRAGKNIEIDTQAPTISGVAAANQMYYNAGSIVSINMTFNENVRITGTPQLNLQLRNQNDNNTRAVTTSGTPKVNNNVITFTYTVQAGDTTRGNLLAVTGFTPQGSITDIAGNPLAAITTARNVTGTYIEANAPNVPVVKALLASANSDANIIENTINGVPVTARSTGNGTQGAAGTAVNLVNIFNDRVWLAIDGNRRVNANNTGTDMLNYKLTDLEYSVNNGVDWVRVTRPAGGWSDTVNTHVFELALNGTYQVIVRQIDAAGNISNWSQPVHFNWDPGTLISRIDSTSANGTYTNSGAGNKQDTINVTVHFRTNVQITGTPSITLNTTPVRTVTGTAMASAGNSISFSYAVNPGENTTRVNAQKDTTAANTYTSRNDANNANANHNFGANGTVFQVSVGTGIFWLRVISANTFRLYLTQADASTTTASNGQNAGSTIITGIPLDVTAINMTGTVGTSPNNITVGSHITNFITSAAVGDTRRLRNRKAITVNTSDLARTAGPNYFADTDIETNDAWTGRIEFDFNRNIQKGSGDIVITQSTTGYRLPAVLTEAQAAKYSSITNFSTFYSRGVNGFSGSASDTSTKFILNYAQSSVVTPNQSAAEGTIARLAWDFLQAERVVIPVSSQDVVVSGDKLTINITGSNALAVLGAQYTVTLPAGAVQDALSFRWPVVSGDQTYTRTWEGINRAFIRVDKKVNADRITAAAGTAAGVPQMNGNFADLLTTTVRFDCRTPSANVRYNTASRTHGATTASVTANGHGTNAVITDDGRRGTGGAMQTGGGSGLFRSNEVADNDIIGFANTGTTSDTLLVRPTINTDNDTGGVTTYSDFTTTITIGGATPAVTAANVTGFTWRVAARSRANIGGADRNSIIISEEVAFRTVLTYELRNIRGTNDGGTTEIGVRPEVGETLWIRGGDALSSSSVPGFPLTWTDNYETLRANGTRAGIRAMQRISGDSPHGGEAAADASIWRWITWEINVRTWHDVVLGSNFNATNTGTPSTANVNDAMQYGPRVWRYQRGGWTASKDIYTLYPGRHRWLRLTGGDNHSPGGITNWTNQINVRDTPAVTFTP